MNWEPINKDNLPDGWVLAACFDKESKNNRQKSIGSLYLWNGLICLCDDEYTIHGVTHYIDIDKFDL
jgi:hypothetical protein